MSALERRLAMGHGTFNLLSGIWPLVGLRSFERVFGPKTDRWLVQTVAGLLATIGWTQFAAAGKGDGGGAGLTGARRLGLGTAATLLAIDLVYVPRRRIRATYLIDAACEVAWLLAWRRASRTAR
jgi:hypothetical protein